MQHSGRKDNLGENHQLLHKKNEENRTIRLVFIAYFLVYAQGNPKSNFIVYQLFFEKLLNGGIQREIIEIIA